MENGKRKTIYFLWLLAISRSPLAKIVIPRAIRLVGISLIVIKIKVGDCRSRYTPSQ